MGVVAQEVAEGAGQCREIGLVVEASGLGFQIRKADPYPRPWVRVLARVTESLTRTRTHAIPIPATRAGLRNPCRTLSAGGKYGTLCIGCMVPVVGTVDEAGCGGGGRLNKAIEPE